MVRVMVLIDNCAWDILESRGVDLVGDRDENLQLPTPLVQVKSSSISLMPRLIARTDLLSFIAREHLLAGKAEGSLREIPLKETTMTRVIGVSYRSEGYKSPAASTLLEILLSNQANLFLQLDA